MYNYIEKTITNFEHRKIDRYLFWLLLYTTSYFLLLTNRGIFWDDWVWQYNLEEMRLGSEEIGQPFWIMLWAFISSQKYFVEIYRVLIFLSYLLPCYFLDTFLSKINILSVRERFWGVTFFCILPFYNARIAISCTQYAICFLLFYFAMFLLVFVKKGNLLVRFLSLGIFFISFFTNSFLVFYWIPVAFLYYNNDFFKDGDVKGIVRTLCVLTIKHIDFILLPFLFWILRQTVWLPSGSYHNYNHIELSSIIYQIIPLSIYTFRNIISPVMDTYSGWLKYILRMIFVLGFILGVIKYKSMIAQIKTTYKKMIFKLTLFLMIIITAILPYVLVNKLPVNAEWSGRHQLLASFGASFLLIFLIKYLLEILQLRKWINIVFIILMLSFTIKNISVYYAFQKDWIKQKSMLSAFRNDSMFKKGTYFFVKDRCINWNYHRRDYRSYEFNGLMTYALGHQKNYMTSSNSMPPQLYPKKLWRRYKYKDFIPTTNKVNVFLDCVGDLNFFNVISLVFDEWFRPEHYAKKVDGLVVFSLEK